MEGVSAVFQLPATGREVFGRVHKLRPHPAIVRLDVIGNSAARGWLRVCSEVANKCKPPVLEIARDTSAKNSIRNFSANIEPATPNIAKSASEKS